MRRGTTSARDSTTTGPMLEGEDIMDRKITWGVLATCAGLAACAGSSNDIAAVIDPTAESLDSALPFGATNGFAVDMLSADLTNGAVNDQATITFNADQTLTITLPDGGSVTIADAFLGPVGPDTTLLTTTANYFDGTYDVDVHLGEEAAGSDLFILARIGDPSPTPANPVTFVVFGDETASLASLPMGGATYTGGFVSDVFNATGAPDAILPQLSGTASITADFNLSTVNLSLTEVGESTGLVIAGNAIPIVGAQYTGPVSGGAYSGNVVGAFYGPGAEATAGTFNVVDPGGVAIGDETIVVGGFTGFLQ